MFYHIKSSWFWITGNYKALYNNVRNKISELRDRMKDNPSQHDYCESMIEQLEVQLEELDKKIQEQNGK